MVGYKPTQAMREAARKSLVERDKYPLNRQPMTSVGVARAKQIITATYIPIKDVKNMYAFHKRHIKNYSDKIDSKGRYTRGRIAIDGWGGLAGKKWTESIVSKLK